MEDSNVNIYRKQVLEKKEMERGALNPTVVATFVPSASVRPRLSATEGENPFQIWRSEHSSSLLKQVLRRNPEPVLNPDYEAAAVAVAALSSPAAWPLSELAVERRARFRIYRRSEPELMLQAEVEPKEEAILHALSTGTNSQGSSGPSTDKGPLFRLDTLPFAANPSWSYRRLRQKISSLPLPPLCKELGNSKDSSPVLLQNSSENSSAPFQVQIAQILGKTILQWVNPTDLV